MEAQRRTNYTKKIRKILTILDFKCKEDKCTICGNRLYPAVKESWYGNTLVDFKIQNGFCEECGLFQFEPEKCLELDFQKSKHKKLYKKNSNCFV